MSDRRLLPSWAERRVAGREQWASRIGFVMAAVGSAVGLGNLWRFPYEAATNGGAAFLVVNVVAVALIGLPAMLAEFVVGRRAKRNVVDAFREGGRAWTLAGVLAALTAFWIVSYYSVVGGWVVRYLLASPTGAYFARPAAYFEAAAVGFDAVGYAAAFLVVTVAIVAMGIERGIELATKVMVPAILLLMVGLAVFAATLPGSGAGYAYFLDPDFGYIVANAATLVPAAVGEVLFTLSLGAGIMITYASYVDETENLVADGAAIVVMNTLVGYLAGLIVFPLLFAQGVEPGAAGPGAIFVSIANAFRTLPGGELLGVVFYLVVFVAALSSAISLLEIPTAYFVDTTDVGRPVVAAALGVGAFLLAVPSALDQGVFGFFDSVASLVLLPTGLFLVTVFVGWVYDREAVAELGGTGGIGGSFPTAWHWYLRVVVFAAVGMTLVLSLASFAGVELL